MWLPCPASARLPVPEIPSFFPAPHQQWEKINLREEVVTCLKSLSKWVQELGHKVWPTSPHFLPLASGPSPVCQASLPPGSDDCHPHRLDRDLNRLPQDLYHARCLCPHCVSLQTGSHMDPLGNSELLYHNQTVFYRRPCPGEQGAPDGYCLEQRLYRVSLACVCVRPRVMA